MYAVYVQYVLKFPETRSTSSYNPLFQNSCTIANYSGVIRQQFKYKLTQSYLYLQLATKFTLPITDNSFLAFCASCSKPRVIRLYLFNINMVFNF